MLKKVVFQMMCLTAFSFCQADLTPQEELYEQYRARCIFPSDIYEHVPVLREVSRKCSSVTEIGVRTMVSTWGILQGLAESTESDRSYVGIDIVYPPADILEKGRRLSEENGVSFKFIRGNDMDLDIEPCDMLFIDSYHTYFHLSYELEKFCNSVHKYITMHDTSYPWGEHNEHYAGDYSEYPPEIDRTKKGLWTAVVDFLEKHPEWELEERRTNNHGFTILRRVGVQ